MRSKESMTFFIFKFDNLLSQIISGNMEKTDCRVTGVWMGLMRA